MKRKVKLFASIASLCLAVALMAFGVYAATSVTYNVTGSVSFTAGVAVKWTGKVEGGKLSEAVTDGTGHTTDGTEATDPAHEWTPTAVEFGTTGTQKTVKYTFTCESMSADPIKVNVAVKDSNWFGDGNLTVKTLAGKTHDADGTDTPLGTLADAESGPDSSATGQITLEKGDIWTFVIEVTLKDVTKALGNDVDFSVILTASR